MGIIILSIICVILWFVISYRIDEFREVLYCLLCVLLATVVSTMAVFGATVLFTSDDDFTYEKVSEVKIVALKDNASVTAAGFILGGYAEGELQYYYARETEQGLAIDKVKASSAFVRYDDRPRIETFQSTGFKDWYTWLFAINYGKRFYHVYVPEGSVSLDIYEIDFE